jgi:hypothetical protein
MATLNRRGAANITSDLDKIASLFQHHANELGIPEKIATDFAYRCDLLADHIEKFAGEDDKSAEDEGEGEEAPADKKAADETGLSVEPAPANQGFDANDIGDEKAGPLEIITPPIEPWMDGHFTQEKFQALREKQESGELASNAAAGRADAKLASLDESLAKLSKLAAVGGLTDIMAEVHVKKLLELDEELKNLEAEIEAAASALLKKQTSLEAEHKKILETLKKNLPETIAGQGSVILQVRGAIIKYAKVAEQKRPGFDQMRSTDTEDPKKKGGDLYGRIQMECGEQIADQVRVIAEAVHAELTHLTPAVRGLQYELANVSKTASNKEAGFLDVIVKFRNWLAANFKKMMQLVGLADTAINKSSKSIMDALKKAEADMDKALEA